MSAVISANTITIASEREPKCNKLFQIGSVETNDTVTQVWDENGVMTITVTKNDKGFKWTGGTGLLGTYYYGDWARK